MHAREEQPRLSRRERILRSFRNKNVFFAVGYSLTALGAIAAGVTPLGGVIIATIGAVSAVGYSVMKIKQVEEEFQGEKGNFVGEMQPIALNPDNAYTNAAQAVARSAIDDVARIRVYSENLKIAAASSTVCIIIGMGIQAQGIHIATSQDPAYKWIISGGVVGGLPSALYGMAHMVVASDMRTASKELRAIKEETLKKFIKLSRRVQEEEKVHGNPALR